MQCKGTEVRGQKITDRDGWMIRMDGRENEKLKGVGNNPGPWNIIRQRSDVGER
jgi:hypothetical protein